MCTRTANLDENAKSAMKTLQTDCARCKMGVQSRVNGNAHCQVEDPANEAVVLGAGRPHSELIENETVLGRSSDQMPCLAVASVVDGVPFRG
jgi:hypothetical protein